MSGVGVVVPMHATRDCLDELLARIAACVPDAEVVLVDDACPQGSGAAVRALTGRLPAGLRCRLVTVRPGVGQHSAVLLGLAESTSAVTVVMDADLQDPPEAIRTLVDALAEGSAPVVAAGRRGSYEARGRLASGRWHRRAMHLASGGRVPRDAGMFLAMTASARDAVLALDDPVAPLVPALARAGIPLRTVPVQRAPRTSGATATTSRVRVRTSVRGLLTVLPVHPFVRSVRARRWQHPHITVTDIGGPP
ncbi:glycosyltransferase [Nocardioides glacieisoli]|uniref:Glycosyltransferase n=1 Tax=Nocardioides glacieisoli TaxID=1168730 RepID=A0A4Q2S5W5_9ACTN|nr:glycosyltransferase [Nocardioides glacieisoli]RYB96736.1 glycosyltransferase [Nocardioides glacieisoli]